MNDHKESREITDPAELVKGRRYEAVDQDHPEYARSVGVFDGIRPDQEVGEDYVYFVNGQIGDVPQRIFGHPATQARCYREVGVNARVQEVTRVDEDGGFYSCQEHSDGSGPTTHYWQAGTGWRPSTEYNLHPFGDEWLWDKTGDKGLTVALNEAVKVAEDHRAECMKGDDSQREFFAGMWFSVCEAESGELVALVSP